MYMRYKKTQSQSLKIAPCERSFRPQIDQFQAAREIVFLLDIFNRVFPKHTKFFLYNF